MRVTAYNPSSNRERHPRARCSCEEVQSLSIQPGNPSRARVDYVHTPAISEARAYAAVIGVWLVAQLIKVVRGIRRERRFDFRWLSETGGMPSSHSAAVSALTTVAALYYGFGSIPFGICLIYSLIIMFDAAGVRRSVGRQASLLNQIIEQLSKQNEIPEEQIREVLGHTPVEVFAGALLGTFGTLIAAFWIP